MTLIFGNYSSSEPVKQIEVPNYENTRGRRGIKNIYWEAFPDFKKVTLIEAIEALIAGWPK